MSDPMSVAPSIAERMDDIRAVMDATGSARAALFGTSEGGTLSLMFALAYPERTAEVIRSGADAVRVGTRFVTSPESGAHPIYVRMLLAAAADDTVLTEWFNEDWPNAPHRVLRSSQVAAEKSGWRAVWPPYRDVDRYPGDMAMDAGMGVGDVNLSQPAAEVVADLVRLL